MEKSIVPLGVFSERGYLEKYQDVANAVRNGEETDGLSHYTRLGQFEGRVASGFDPAYYMGSYPQVAEEIAEAGGLGPFDHYLSHGRKRGYLGRPPVRLVIWDLDETFWKGTVAEGGIREYVQEHHDIVIELARRGIISSICSKNDEATTLDLLRLKGILDYFVFPSISWDPKGNRLAELIELVQLRQATVMFVDDGPGNRAEAGKILPDLQIEDENFISMMLEDPRFRGKEDRQLSRLTEYRLLERRNRDQRRSSGTNEEFLRGSDIRLCIEYDVAAHMDRAIELIRRTNQLNFTKKRLPEDIREARLLLADELHFFRRQAGLVRVVDNYGDYGFVGFFVTESLRSEHVPGAAHRTLQHFCFSCRILGMFVEQWLYEYLGKPQLRVVGDVLTDLSVPRSIDWIRLVETVADGARPVAPVAPEVRVYGGCEANPIAVYLNAYSQNVRMLSNFAANGLFVRINSAVLALSAFARSRDEFADEALALGLPVDLMAGDYFADAPDGTVFIFSSGLDSGNGFRYRHRRRGWEICVHPASCVMDFNAVSDDELRDTLRSRLGDEALEHNARVAQHIRANYETIHWLSDDESAAKMRTLIEHTPDGSKLVFLLDHDWMRSPRDGVLRHAPFVTQYNALVRSIAKQYPYVATVSFTDVIDSEDQVQVGGNHYDRLVYVKTGGLVVDAIRHLPPKQTERTYQRTG
jgi:FkbH-like protein